jgi:hypothetical protein
MYDVERECFNNQEGSKTMMFAQETLLYHVTTVNVDIPALF